MEFTLLQAIGLISIGAIITAAFHTVIKLVFSPGPRALLKTAHRRTFGKSAPAYTNSKSRANLDRVLSEYGTERRNVKKLSRILHAEEDGDDDPITVGALKKALFNTYDRESKATASTVIALEVLDDQRAEKALDYLAEEIDDQR